MMIAGWGASGISGEGQYGGGRFESTGYDIFILNVFIIFKCKTSHKLIIYLSVSLHLICYMVDDGGKRRKKEKGVNI